MINKFCMKCKLNKEVEYFSRCIKNKDGLQQHCKLCKKKYQQNQSKRTPKGLKGNWNLNKIIGVSMEDQSILFYDKLNDVTNDNFNPGKVSLSCKTLNNSHKDYIWFYEKEFNVILFYLKLEYINRPKRVMPKIQKEKACVTCGEIKLLKYFHLNKRGRFGRDSSCRPCRHTYLYVKMKRNVLLKLKHTLRSRTNKAIKTKNFNKNSSFKEYIGCSAEELKSKLELLFLPGMTWENHSLFGWHIDHIIPLSSAETVDDLYKLCHYTNLQPLWREDNIRKGNKLC